jgi:hypothetical protein
MKPRLRDQIARLCRAAGAACLFLAACDPVDSPTAPRPRYKPPVPEPRRAIKTSADNSRWIEAWRDLRSRLAPLEQQLAEAQKFHAENQFDSFLDLDPEAIEKDQLCSLFHFLERGYFTVERRILIHLLERRLERAAAPLAIPSGSAPRLKERLAAAMQRDELRMVDLETAIEFYREPDTNEFQIPESLTDDEMSELRTAVAAMLDDTRSTVAELDEKLAALKARAFGEPGAP